MKRIKVPQLDIKGMEDPFFELSKACLNHAPEKGFDAETMRARIKVMDILGDREGEIVGLEDADYGVLKECVKVMRWALLDKEILKFIDAVNTVLDEPVEQEVKE